MANISNDFVEKNDLCHNFEKQYIIGRNPILEAFNSDFFIDTVLISNKNRQGSINKIIAISKDRNITLKYVNDKKLDSICGVSSHQGVVAIIGSAKYSSIDDIFEFAKSRCRSPFIVIADQIEDPHNLGAIIRTAECCGADGVIIPKRRSASLTPILSKTSCGAINHIPIVKVTNLSSTIDLLKSMGVWIYACDMDGDILYNFDYSGPIAIIVGSEGKGVSKLIKQKSDFIVSIPIKGKINSLNASVACGIVMYEALRKRHF